MVAPGACSRNLVNEADPVRIFPVRSFSLPTAMVRFRTIASRIPSLLSASATVTYVPNASRMCPSEPPVRPIP